MTAAILAAAWCGWVAGCALAIPPVAVLYRWAVDGGNPETGGRS
jgi:hypothetical protein